MKVCIATSTLWEPHAGGHAWVYLNWAFGLRANGCDVLWMEELPTDIDSNECRRRVCSLKEQMSGLGLEARIALLGGPETDWMDIGTSWEAAAEESDLLLNFHYGLPGDVLERFRKSALIDIDPALLQVWISEHALTIGRHDINFTIGETVGRPGARFPECGMRWHYTRPPVHLESWPVTRSDDGAAYTTITNWWEKDQYLTFQEETFSNVKRDSFLEFAELAPLTEALLELAICYTPGDAQDEEDRSFLERKGWRVQHAWNVASTPIDYRSYIRRSKGEFSCAKPSCMRFANAWVSDRTLCYLASGKPAIVQHTGRSDFLPDSDGLFRFRTLDEAVRSLSVCESQYQRHSRAARALAEEFFDAKKVVCSVIERALA